jgi:hypothetical protein
MILGNKILSDDKSAEMFLHIRIEDPEDIDFETLINIIKYELNKHQQKLNKEDKEIKRDFFKSEFTAIKQYRIHKCEIKDEEGLSEEEHTIKIKLTLSTREVLGETTKNRLILCNSSLITISVLGYYERKEAKK